MNIKNIWNNTKTYTQIGVNAAAKSIFKIGLFVTGIASYFTPWMETPFGTLPIVQVFAVLNILIAVGWELTTHFKKPAKKSK